MSVSASTQIPKTSDPAVFQRQCKVLFEQVLKDPNVQEYGSSGQGQQGVDLLGRRRHVSLDHWVGIQCKLTIKAKKLKKGTVRHEATLALAFQPPLKEYIIATTADDDAAAQSDAALVTNEQASLGRDFTVQVWGWQTLQAHILQYEAAIDAFSPDAFPHLRHLLRGQDKIQEQVSEVGETQVVMLEALQRIERQTASGSAAIASPAVWDDSSVDTLLDRQIDEYRDMLNTGQPRTALRLLEGLWSSLPPSVGGRIRFRIQTNIAACKLHLGDHKSAGALYLDAYEHAPTEPKAASLKVLGHILLDQAAEARAFGLASLGGNCDQGPLVAHLIIAAKLLPDEDDPFRIISPELEHDPSVAVAKIDYLRTRSDRGAWWQLAHDAHARHSDNENLRRFAAEADIDEGCKWADDHARTVLPAEFRERIIKATNTLRELWDEALQSEDAWGDLQASLGSSLSTGYRLLRRYERAKAIILQGLERFPDDALLLEQHLLIAVEEGDATAVKDTIGKLPPSRDAIFGRLQVCANKGDWAGINELADQTDISKFTEDDRAFFESLSLLSGCKLSTIADPRTAIADLLAKYPDQAVVPIVLHEVAVQAKDPIWSGQLYQVALYRRASLNSASRSMLARIAEQEKDADTVVDLLDGHVYIDQDSDDLRILARGFVNGTARQAAVAFVDELAADLASQPFYARVVGSIHFNRGALPQAEEAFRKAIAADASDLAAHLGLLNTLLRQDRRDLVEEHLRELRPGELKGPPAQKMGLAQLFAAFGRGEDALSLGYETALNNRDDLRAVQLYIGLILPDPTGALIPDVGPEIQMDCWVLLERSDGHRLALVIESGPNRPSLDHYSPEHGLAKMLIGRKKDDVIVSTPPLGTEETWRVVDFKHKFLALLHDIMETLPSRFPTAQGIYRFQVKENDLAPFLDQVKSLSERDAEIFNLYLRDGYPLGLASSLLGRSSIEFAGQVVGRGEVVRTCFGTGPERRAAIASVYSANHRGIVLDSYTAWVAYSLGLIEVLKSLFGRVALPQSSIDELLEWRQRFEPTGDQPLMTIGYAQGRYFREEIPAERLAQAVVTINTGIETLRHELEVLPAAAPLGPSALEKVLLGLVQHGFLDPVYLSAAEDLLLVSEDLHYRNLARQLHRRHGVWLQVVLMIALDTGRIEPTAYAHAICDLAIRRHDHVALSAATLVALAMEEQNGSMDRFRAAAAFIGTDNADLESHQRVSWEFLRAIWETNLPYVRRAKAASIILERLVHLMFQRNILPAAYSAMIANSRNQPLLEECLVAWARGHFISLSSS
jgi:tetratricopeptide (TPR) repeat protein